MTAQRVRDTSLQYFADRGHRIVRSSPLLPKDDPTILFANAGMNQFKNVFLGLEKRGYARAATIQKCMRVSGKPNDLEAFRLWAEEGGVPKTRIFRYGKKDNFWAMGDTGPCGPCSELHYDLGEDIQPGDPFTLIEKGR